MANPCSIIIDIFLIKKEIIIIKILQTSKKEESTIRLLSRALNTKTCENTFFVF